MNNYKKLNQIALELLDLSDFIFIKGKLPKNLQKILEDIIKASKTELTDSFTYESYVGNVDYLYSPYIPHQSKYKFKHTVPVKRFDNSDEIVEIEIPSWISAIFAIFMFKIRNMEWGAYLIHEKLQPDCKKILITDILFIPQDVSGGHVEYLEELFPDFCQELFKYKFTHGISRVHSHHSLGAFHSSTDEDELLNAVNEDSKIFLSIVLSNKKKFNNFDEFIDVLNIDAKVIFPRENKIPLVKSTEVFFEEYNEEELIEAKQTLDKYESMLQRIEKEKDVRKRLKAIDKMTVLRDATPEVLDAMSEIYEPPKAEVNKEKILNYLKLILKEVK